LLKDTTAEELLDAIRIVHQGKKYIPPQVALKLAERLNNSDLTRRELEVLQPLVVGKSNLEIGAALSITEGTAKFHVNNIHRCKSAIAPKPPSLPLKRGLARLET